MALSIYQNKIKYIAALAIVVFIIFSLFKIPNTITELINNITSALALTAIFISIFDMFLWRLLPECILGIPKIYGTWRGTLSSKWLKLETMEFIDKNVDPFYITIKQKFSSLSLVVHTSESSSISLTSNIIMPEIGVKKICYSYDNSPQLNLHSKSPRHRGSAELKVININDKRVLDGEYWTDRWSQGTMQLYQHKKDLADCFEAAQSIFDSGKKK